MHFHNINIHITYKVYKSIKIYIQNTSFVQEFYTKIQDFTIWKHKILAYISDYRKLVLTTSQFFIIYPYAKQHETKQPHGFQKSFTLYSIQSFLSLYIYTYANIYPVLLYRFYCLFVRLFFHFPYNVHYSIRYKWFRFDPVNLMILYSMNIFITKDHTVIKQIITYCHLLTVLSTFKLYT